MITYVALLRGINVGPNKKVSMGTLKSFLEKSGFAHVKTLLNSGNVVFDVEKKAESALEAELSELLAEKFGFKVSVLVRTMEDIQKLVDSKPFKNVQIEPETRLYVTFLTDKPETKLKFPYTSPDKQLQILSANNRVLVSVLTLSEFTQTTDAMRIIEQEFGKKITTRNWNTIEKLVKLTA
jgi:uncharacterized protein (DUF1697 family)